MPEINLSTLKSEIKKRADHTEVVGADVAEKLVNGFFLSLNNANVAHLLKLTPTNIEHYCFGPVIMINFDLKSDKSIFKLASSLIYSLLSEPESEIYKYTNIDNCANLFDIICKNSSQLSKSNIFVEQYLGNIIPILFSCSIKSSLYQISDKDRFILKNTLSQFYKILNNITMMIIQARSCSDASIAFSNIKNELEFFKRRTNYTAGLKSSSIIFEGSDLSDVTDSYFTDSFYPITSINILDIPQDTLMYQLILSQKAFNIKDSTFQLFKTIGIRRIEIYLLRSKQFLFLLSITAIIFFFEALTLISIIFMPNKSSK